MNETFETYRPYLFAIAYRMLGSAMDAEDMVQETYLRYQATPPGTILSLKAYLTTIISRLCVDQLHLVRRKREQYLGPWLPEPMVVTNAPELVEVEKHVDEYESISLAFLIMLEQLQLLERAVFLLREVFEYDYAEIAAILNKSEATCRQSLSRAKKHLVDHRPRFSASPELQRQLLTSFLQAIDAGEMNALIDLLAQDVTFWCDGGGKVKEAATRPVSGSQAVARFFFGNDHTLVTGSKTLGGKTSTRCQPSQHAPSSEDIFKQRSRFAHNQDLKWFFSQAEEARGAKTPSSLPLRSIPQF